jgi:hypothetical protein
MSEHTPGPWKIGTNPKYVEIWGGTRMNASPILASLECEPRDANAAFIVTACNEHAALRRRVVALETIIRNNLHPDDVFDELDSMLVEEIRALKTADPTSAVSSANGATSTYGDAS